jgi:hypothetical protein
MRTELKPSRKREKMWRGGIMKMRKYRRKRVSRKILEQVQARLARLSQHQTERLERHRVYLETYWNSPVSPAEAFVDVVGLDVDRRARSRREIVQ